MKDIYFTHRKNRCGINYIFRNVCHTTLSFFAHFPFKFFPVLKFCIKNCWLYVTTATKLCIYMQVYIAFWSIFSRKFCSACTTELSCYSRFKEKARTFERESMQNFKTLYNTTSMLLCLLSYITIHIAHDRKRKFLEQVSNFDANEQQEHQQTASLDLKREKSETKKGKLCESREKAFQAAQVYSWHDWNKKSSQQNYTWTWNSLFRPIG